MGEVDLLPPSEGNKNTRTHAYIYADMHVRVATKRVTIIARRYRESKNKVHTAVVCSVCMHVYNSIRCEGHS